MRRINSVIDGVVKVKVLRKNLIEEVSGAFLINTPDTVYFNRTVLKGRRIVNSPGSKEGELNLLSNIVP